MPQPEMISNIQTILLLPHAGLRDRVLAPHAPSCRRVAPGRTLSWGTLVGEPGDVRHHAHAGSCPVDDHVYLPLFHDGTVVSSGVMRAWFEADNVLYDEQNGLSDALYGSVDDLIAAVSSWRRDGCLLGTLLLLDADGKEVSGG